MMRIILIFFLFIACYCSGSNLPTRLKCADKLCKGNVSTGRILQHTKALFGDLKDLKKSSKINIKGKNVDNKNSLWLVELNGMMGFVDLSLLNENQNSVVNDIEVVDNPFYIRPSKDIFDETEYKEDHVKSTKEKTSRLVQNSDDVDDDTESVDPANHDNLSKGAAASTIKSIDISDSILGSERPSLASKDNIAHFESKDVTVLNEKIPVTLEEPKFIGDEVTIDNSNIPKKDLEDIDSTTNESVNNSSQPTMKNTEELRKSEKESLNSNKVIINNGNQQATETIKHDLNVSPEISESYIHDVKNGSPSSTSKQEASNINNESVSSESHHPSKVALPDIIEESSTTNKASHSGVSHETLKSNISDANNDTSTTSVFNEIKIAHKSSIPDTNSESHSTKESAATNEKSVSSESHQTTKSSIADVNNEYPSSTSRKESNKISSPESQNDGTTKNEQFTPNEDIHSKKYINEVRSNDSHDDSVSTEKKIVSSESQPTGTDKPASPTYSLNDSQPTMSDKPVSLLDSLNHSQQAVTDKPLSPTDSLNASQQTVTDKPVSLIDSLNESQQTVPDKPLSPTDSLNDSQQTVTDKPLSPTDSRLNDSQQTVTDKPLSPTDSRLNDSQQTMTDKSLSPTDNLTEGYRPVEIDKVFISKEVPSVASKENVSPTVPDPWLTASDRNRDGVSTVRSPLLRLIVQVEHWLNGPIHSLIQKTGLGSNIYVTKFVHTWLCMSLENFVLILSLLSSIVIVAYTPKMLRLSRDWKREFDTQSQLTVELESRLQTTEEVRQKLTIQNRNFERVIDEYKGRVVDIQEDANKTKRAIVADLEKMKRSNDHKVHKLSQDLEASGRQCEAYQGYIEEKEAQMEEINEERAKVERDFRTHQSAMKGAMDEYQERLQEMGELKEEVERMSGDKRALEEQVEALTASVSEKDHELAKLRSCFEDLRGFEELAGEECKQRVEQCLQYKEVSQRLEVTEKELAELRVVSRRYEEQIGALEERRIIAEGRAQECEQQRARAAKDQEAAEMKLAVLTDYFRKKEVEMQRSLGHESVEKSISLDQTETYRNRIENLESENESLTRTIERMKVEVKESQTFAVRCKNEANTQLATAFLSSSSLERELMREKEESKKLRCKLSYYVGPSPPPGAVLNHTRERPPSRQSGVSEAGSYVPPPPIFPLAMLPQSGASRTPFSGRNSANSVSRKSNHS